MGFCGYLKQSTAVDVLLGPFIDDTDGKTAETGLTLDVEVSKNGQALANKNDVTAPTHDAAGTVDGYYNCELDATDTGTLGILSVVAHAAGFLPVHQTYQIVTANWYDTMCSTDTLQADLTQMGGVAQSATDLKDFADAGYDPATNKVQGVVLVDTTTTNTDMVAAAPTAAAVVNEWETQSQADPTGFHVNVLEVGGTAQTANDNGADINAILVDTAVIGAAGAGLTAVPWNAAWDAEVQSEAQDAIEANDLDHLIQVTAGVEEPTDGSYLDQIMHAGVGQTFDATTDSLEAMRDRGDAAWITAPNDPTAAAIVNEWETQSQADPTGFHVNVLEVGGTAQTANDNGADINTLITEVGKVPKSDAAVSWNATALAAINAECDTAIADADLSRRITLSGTANAGDTTVRITLTGGVATDNYYNGQLVIITGGTGVGQARTILNYLAAGTAATPTRDWLVAPDGTSTFVVFGSDYPPILEAGVAQAGGAATITLDANASATADIYVNNHVMITGGTGLGQTRLIGAYNGGTKVVTVVPNWTTNPDATSIYQILPAARVDVAGWAGTLVTLSANNKPDVNVDEWSDVLLATTNPLPNAAADAAGGLPVSDAGGLDMDAILADTNELQTDDYPTSIAAVQTTADAIEVDTQNIQSRLPAALVTGRMSSDAVAVSGSTDAADKLEASVETVVIGTVNTGLTGATTTTFVSDDIVEATADHFNGRIVIWTSGNLLAQATDITDYVLDGNGEGAFVVTAMTEAPANNDTFVIV